MSRVQVPSLTPLDRRVRSAHAERDVKLPSYRKEAIEVNVHAPDMYTG